LLSYSHEKAARSTEQWAASLHKVSSATYQQVKLIEAGVVYCCEIFSNEFLFPLSEKLFREVRISGQV